MQLLLIIILCVIATIIYELYSERRKYGYKNNKKINKKNISFFREIPCDNDIYYANILIKLNKFNYKETNILGAIILKFLKDHKIKFILKNGRKLMKLNSEETFDVFMEKEIYRIFYDASNDGILEPEELKRWCKLNSDRFLRLFSRIEDYALNKLKREKHIYERKSQKECHKKIVMDDKIYQDSINLYGLKLYLREFSNMNSRGFLEVNLWDDYLIFAYLLGEADNTAKQIEELNYNNNSEFVNSHNLASVEELSIANTIYNSTVEGIEAGKNKGLKNNYKE